MATTNSDSSVSKNESRREEIGLRLRTARQMAGLLTQGQVARLLKLHRPSVSGGAGGWSQTRPHGGVGRIREDLWCQS